MFKSLRELTKSAVGEYEEQDRIHWIKTHATQVVITVVQSSTGRGRSRCACRLDNQALEEYSRRAGASSSTTARCRSAASCPS